MINCCVCSPVSAYGQLWIDSKLPEGEAIEHPMVKLGSLESAQHSVRLKHAQLRVIQQAIALNADDVANDQRKVIYPAAQ